MLGAIPFQLGSCVTPEVENETLGICNYHSLGSDYFVCAYNYTSSSGGNCDGNCFHPNINNNTNSDRDSNSDADINANNYSFFDSPPN
jgi:hypothetical protein